jgi:hypothetical protein
LRSQTPKPKQNQNFKQKQKKEVQPKGPKRTFGKPSFQLFVKTPLLCVLVPVISQEKGRTEQRNRVCADLRQRDRQWAHGLWSGQQRQIKFKIKASG